MKRLIDAKPIFRFSLTASVLIAAMGITALAIRTVVLIPATPQGYPMRPLSSITFIGVSIGLYALVAGRQRLAQMAAVSVMVSAALAILAHWGRLSALPYDTSWAIQGLTLLARTAFQNTLSFLLLGSAIYAMPAQQTTIWRPIVACVAGALASTLGAASLLATLLQRQPISGAFEAEAAIDAAICSILAGVAICRIAHSRLDAHEDRPVVTLPVVVAIVGAIISFLIWRMLLLERTTDIADHCTDAATAIARTLNTELRGRLQALRGAFVPYSAQPDSDIIWLRFAPDGTVADASPAILDSSTLKALDQARQDNEAVIAVLPPDGGPATIVLVVPMYYGSIFRGFRAATLTFNEVFQAIGRDLLGPNYQMFYNHPNGTRYSLPDPLIAYELSPHAELHSGALGGALRVHPGSAYIRRGATWAAHVALSMGIAAAFLLALSIYLVTISQQRLALVQAARVGLEREIEERRKAEQELAKQAELLENSNADLREFAYVTSHDLQEPLRSITSFAQLLSRRYRGQIDSDADEFLDFITQAAGRMSALIQSLLLYSRVVNAAETREEVPMSEVVEWAKSNLALAIEENAASVSTDPLPVVNGNRVQLGQLFQNLLANALKYRRNDPPVIRIGHEPVDGRYMFFVTDNGLGIPPESTDRVFGLFKRLHGPEYPGTGIGLALCKRIVQKHGGRIWIESTPGQGTTVFFTLPST